MNCCVRTVLPATLATILIATGVSPASAQAPPGGPAATVEVQGGTATFDVGTNVSAISVHGKSTNLRGRAQIRQAGDAIAIGELEATLPVTTITTGMGLRDSHMRKYVFTTGDGQTPDLTFVADSAECAAAAAGRSTCTVSGQLAIRGTPKPFAITLNVSKLGDGYHAAGEGTVKLSAYGIPPPSQLGVTTNDDVKLRLEFTAKPANRAAEGLRDGR